MSLGERIRALRKQRGWTQARLSERLNLDDTTISAYERGVSRPDVGILRALAAAFEVPIDYLVAGSWGSGPGQLTIHVPVLVSNVFGAPLLNDVNISSYVAAPLHLAEKANCAWGVADAALSGVGIEPGDLVYLSTDTKDLADGDLVLATIISAGEEMGPAQPAPQPGTVLRFYRDQDENRCLVAANPDYDQIQVDANVEIQAIFVGLLVERVPRDLRSQPRELTRDELVARLAQVDGVDPDTIAGLLEVLRRRK